MISAYGISLGAKQRLFPYQAAITSALEISDEYCIVYDPRFDDINIFQTISDRVIPIEYHYDFMEWDFINTALTKARQSCSGDWCLYLELDEVLHEKDKDVYLEAIEFANINRINTISIPYLDIRGNYYKIFGTRQKLIRNISNVIHKTSDYMIGTCDSKVWNGKYILPGFDDVSYYDTNTKAWYNDPNALTMGNTIDKPFIWHYAWYNLERKHKQGEQNRMWQWRTYNISTEYDEEKLIESFKEQIVLQNFDYYNDIEMQDFIRLPFNHPKYVFDWIKEIDKNASTSCS